MSKENVESRVQRLSTVEKRLLRFYMNLPEQELEKQANKFLSMISNYSTGTVNTKENQSKKIGEFNKEVELISLAYAMKKYKLTVPMGGGRKTRRHKKSRQSRKLKR